MNGDRRADRLLVSGDVIHFSPIGPQVAVLGGINYSAVFELKRGETASDLIRMAGGFSPGGRRDVVSRLLIHSRGDGFIPQSPAALDKAPLNDGDILLIADSSTVRVSNQKMAKRITIHGNVQNPGEYILPPDATLKEAINRAGGLIEGAFLYGLRLTRRSILDQERVTMRRVLREFEREYIAQGTVKPVDTSDAQMLTARLEFSQKLLSRLQTFEPEGRLVLALRPDSKEIPDVSLEDGDSVTIPSMPRSIGVFGSVTSPGSYNLIPGGKAADYVSVAGGVTKGADTAQAFIIHANGQSSKGIPQLTTWTRMISSKRDPDLFPGDTIVIPEDMNKVAFTRQLVQWSQILYQLGLGVAAIKVLQQ
jgi:protein involved in polysaccharide export with SLBB domain